MTDCPHRRREEVRRGLSKEGKKIQRKNCGAKNQKRGGNESKTGRKNGGGLQVTTKVPRQLAKLKFYKLTHTFKHLEEIGSLNIGRKKKQKMNITQYMLH